MSDKNPWICGNCGGTVATKDGLTCPYCVTSLNPDQIDLDNDAVAAEWGARKLVEMKKARAAREQSEPASTSTPTTTTAVSIGSGQTVVITTDIHSPRVVIATQSNSNDRKTCNKCGISNRSDANFCKNCGNEF